MLLHHPFQLPWGEDLQPLRKPEEETDQFPVDDDIELENRGTILVGFHSHLAAVDRFGLDIRGIVRRGPETHFLRLVSRQLGDSIVAVKSPKS